MNYQSLIYFKNLAELRHYTKTAKKLFISQPTLSKAIQGLETELGVPLFKKEGHNITLTQFGRSFYPYVKDALEKIDLGISHINQLIEQESSTIFLSCLYSMYSFFLTNKILAFRKTFPKSKFSVEYKFTTAILNDVIEGHCELGICSDFDEFPKKDLLSWVALYQEPVCFITSKGSSLACKKKVTEKELCDYPFVAYHISHLGTNRIFYELCEKYGKKPTFTAEGYNDFGVLNLVAMNEGIAIVPISNYLKLDNVVRLNVETSIPLYRNLNLVWLKNEKLSPIVNAFHQELMQK